MTSYLRDMANRVIRQGDYIVWGATRQGYGMRLARVTRFTAQRVHAVVLETGVEHHFNPCNSLVVTAQIQANLDGNVGGSDAPIVEVPRSSGSSMATWAERRQ